MAKVLGVSASSSVLPMNIQDWFPLGWTGWISLLSKGLSRILNYCVFRSQTLSQVCLLVYMMYSKDFSMIVWFIEVEMMKTAPGESWQYRLQLRTQKQSTVDCSPRQQSIFFSNYYNEMQIEKALLHQVYYFILSINAFPVWYSVWVCVYKSKSVNVAFYALFS